MLKSLEISGFKSFGKKVNLDFKSKVTAIVGPNGSGKSNVAEAFRFALGEQSIKSLRGKRGEDLIWNGSQEIPRSNRAQVKLVFDNKQKLFSLDFDEVSIERAVSRDGENEYSINGTKVRLKDVVELLAQAHIGNTGHQIISQGEADRILRASIKERREMVEDALGLKIYLYKREESQKKLVKTEENIKQVESLRREIAPHIKFLKKQVEKFERAEELRQKLVIFYKEYLKREKYYIENEEKKIDQDKKPLENRLSELEKLMLGTKEVLQYSSSKDDKSENLLKIEDRIENTRKEKDLLERELGQIEGEMTSNQKSLNKTLELAKSEENRTIKVKEVERLAEDIFILTDIAIIFQKIKDFLDKFKDHVDIELVEEIKRRNKELGVLKTEKELALKRKEVELRKALDDYTEIKRSIEKEKESGREAEKTIFRINMEQNEVKIKLQALGERERKLESEKDNLYNQIKEGGALLGEQMVGFENLEIGVLDEDRKINEDRKKELEKMKIRFEELGGAGGLEIIKEYKEVSERDAFLAHEIEDLHKSADSLKILISDLEEKLNVEFKEGIEKINISFQKFFETMFDGGSAKLKIEKMKIKRFSDLEESLVQESEQNEEETKEGLDIEVSLPRKRTKGLEMLSGGERALTSIALLFAISQVNPPPFIILDETDAALDEANSKRYGDMIESLARVSQLILITHNRETMSRAGVIYGVTMGRDSISRLLSIAFDEAVVVAK